MAEFNRAFEFEYFWQNIATCTVVFGALSGVDARFYVQFNPPTVLRTKGFQAVKSGRSNAKRCERIHRVLKEGKRLADDEDTFL